MSLAILLFMLKNIQLILVFSEALDVNWEAAFVFLSHRTFHIKIFIQYIHLYTILAQ